MSHKILCFCAVVLLTSVSYSADLSGIDWASVSKRTVERFSTAPIAGVYRWKWRALADPILVHNDAYLAELADAPVVDVAWPVRFSQVLYNILRYAHSSQRPQSARDEAELKLLRSVLFKPTAWPWQWLPGEPEYIIPLRPSCYVQRYRRYAMEWAKAADELEAIRRHGGTQAEIIRAERRVRCRWNLWEEKGYRKELTTIQQRYEFLITRDGAVWSDAEALFTAAGIPDLIRHGRPAPVEIEDRRALQWQRDEVVDRDGQKRSLESTIARVNRSWLDERPLFNLCWQWSPNAPWGQELISDGSSAKPQGLFPSFVERAVLIRFPEEPELVYAVAFVGEVLPRLPPDCGAEPASRSDPPSSPHRRSTILDRLLNATF
jgi:hypothetical protein